MLTQIDLPKILQVPKFKKIVIPIRDSNYTKTKNIKCHVNPKICSLTFKQSKATTLTRTDSPKLKNILYIASKITVGIKNCKTIRYIT